MATTDEVFISYSYDSPEHIGAVLDLSNRLRKDGVDCVLDQYETSPPEGWPRWMDKKMRKSKYVIVVCTETYYGRVTGEADPSTGHGVRWESHLTYQQLYDAGSLNKRFVPVVFRNADKQFVPDPLRGSTIHVLDVPDGYERLYAHLTDTPFVKKPDLGKRRAPLPKKPVKTNPAWFVTSPIDVELWDKAGWNGVFFMHVPGRPPYLGLAFRDEDAAQEIFRQWHQRYGKRDADEELRISIVEGDIKGEEPGYTVHVSADLDVTMRKLKAAGFGEDDLLLSFTRLNRMNPATDSPNLELFKKRFREFKTYFLIPAVWPGSGGMPKSFPELGIFKSKIFFRHVDEIGPNDIDVVVLGSGERKRSRNPDYPEGGSITRP